MTKNKYPVCSASINVPPLQSFAVLPCTLTATPELLIGCDRPSASPSFVNEPVTPSMLLP